MLPLFACGALMLPLYLSPDAGSGSSVQAKSIYDFTVKDIEGQDVSLSKYKGDVVMIVNVASY